MACRGIRQLFLSYGRTVTSCDRPSWPGGAISFNLSRLRAAKVRRIVRATRTAITSHLRERTQGARHRGLSAAAGAARCNDLIGRFAGFSPALECTEEIRLVRPNTAAAMADSRQQE